MKICSTIGLGHIEIEPVEFYAKGSMPIAIVKSGIPAYSMCIIKSGEHEGKIGICAMHSCIRMAGKFIIPLNYLLQIVELEEGEQVMSIEFNKEETEQFRGPLG